VQRACLLGSKGKMNARKRDANLAFPSHVLPSHLHHDVQAAKLSEQTAGGGAAAGGKVRYRAVDTWHTGKN